MKLCMMQREINEEECDKREMLVIDEVVRDTMSNQRSRVQR